VRWERIGCFEVLLAEDGRLVLSAPDPGRVDWFCCSPHIRPYRAEDEGMRRYLAIGMALATVAAGCGSTGEPHKSRPPGTTTAPPAGGDLGDRAHAIGESAALGGGSVAVVAVEDNVDAGRLFAPPRGTRYLAVDVRACAGPKEIGVNFRPEYFAVRLTDHTEHDADRGVKKPALRPSVLPPGGCTDGWVSFVVPTGATLNAVVYHGSNDVTWTPTKPTR
jgi:hypothetical protein